MYLKNIEINGFKSFANKINLEFHNGITGIVGPNGSGKSNIADAVRWVLGSQKVKQLRSSKMEDVIFSGTENRKPMGYAYVAITFDNSDHQLNIDYNEVTVSRRLFRSGESEYMINGTQVRLKDVHELFFDTGIGKEGYSIIGQGQIDKILSTKPEDRRELFDEAAGIVKYKTRKDEAIKKLNDQNQNLVRVTDILSELERQVGPLEKQAEKAKRYLVLKDNLKQNDVNMFLIEMDEIKNKISDITSKLEIANNDFSNANEEFEKIKHDYTKLEELIENLNKSIEDKTVTLNETTLNIEKFEGQINVIKEQINSAKSNESFINQRIDSVKSEIEARNKELAESEQEKYDNEVKLNEVIAKQSDANEEINNLNWKIQELETEISDNRNEALEIMNSKASIKTEIEKFDTKLEQINIRKSQIDQKLVEFQSKKEGKENAIAQFEGQLIEINKDIETVTKSLDDYTEKLKELRIKNNNLTEKWNNNRAKNTKAKSNLETLRNLTERYEGYGSSVKRVMELKESKKGIVGVVADIIQVDKKYETAIETALGGNIQNVVTDSEQTAKETIAHLKQNKLGRATFLPLNTMKNKDNFNEPKALNEIGAIGVASDLVDVKGEYEGVAKYLLGRVMVVDTIDHAIAIEKKFDYKVRIVTLEGEYLNVGGSISGGTFKNASNLLGRRREIEELEDKIAKLEDEKNDIEKEQAATRGEINAVSEEIDKVNESLQEQQLTKNTLEINLKQATQDKENLVTEYADVNKENDNIESEISDIKKDAEELSAKLSSQETRDTELTSGIKAKNEELEKMQTDLTSKKAALDEINIEIANVKQKHQFIMEKINISIEAVESLTNELKGVETNANENTDEIAAREDAIKNFTEEVEKSKALIETLNKEIEETKEEKEKQNREHKEFFEKREELSSRISTLDKEIYRLNSQKESLEEKSTNKEEYMWDEYEITFRAALDMKSEEELDKPTIKENIANIRREIRSLGDVNINAIEEFKEVNERYSFMKEQHDDLMEAKENLLKIIDELEVGMRKQFTEKFAEIKTQFDKVFKELFGGGKGTIELTEADDILDAGIEIISQPPGKKLQNMMQLSGGEKALTAISLMFAIQNLKPSPFCLLDEIEAALDGTNVIRYAEYLHKLTEHTQFIIITHRRGTMNTADRLYGITMQEKGVSTLVSVDLIESSLDK